MLMWPQVRYAPDMTAWKPIRMTGYVYKFVPSGSARDSYYLVFRSGTGSRYVFSVSAGETVAFAGRLDADLDPRVSELGLDDAEVEPPEFDGPLMALTMAEWIQVKFEDAEAAASGSSGM